MSIQDIKEFLIPQQELKYFIIKKLKFIKFKKLIVFRTTYSKIIIFD
jgi:hypothetical protein